MPNIRADVGIGPYEKERATSTTRASGAQRSVCAADGRDGWESRQRSPQKGPSTPDNPSVSLRLTAPFTQGSLGDGGSGRRGRRPLRKVYRSPSNGLPYLGHGFRRPNSVPKFGASVRSSAPTESPSQPTRSEASAPAVTRSKRESAQRPSKRGSPPATTQVALSEAESAGIIAGQIRSLPDDIRVQHGVQRSEVSAKPRPCLR